MSVFRLEVRLIDPEGQVVALTRSHAQQSTTWYAPDGVAPLLDPTTVLDGFHIAPILRTVPRVSGAPWPDPSADVIGAPDGCQHAWAYSGTAYGGDDESYHGEGRAYCLLCGADGDG